MSLPTFSLLDIMFKKTADLVPDGTPKSKQLS